MTKQILRNLINRQKAEAEIDKYKEIKATIDEFWDILLKCNIAKRKEKPTLEEFAEAISEIETEAIKEFAERLKEKYKKHFNRSYNLIYDSIDNLVKEMVGD